MSELQILSPERFYTAEFWVHSVVTVSWFVSLRIRSM